MNLRTPITDLLGTAHPIVQGGMMWVGTAQLAAAVSNGGGFGIVTALTQPTPEALWEEISRCRALTKRPFGVNLTMLPTINPPPYERYLGVIIESRVTAIETAGRVPPEFIARAKNAGLKVIHKCVSLRHALSAQKHGVDAISIDGFECAGHPGEDDVGGLVLIPIAARKLSVPIIASGGIGDGRGMAATLTLGAHGVNMGTRFCATREAPLHENIKRALIDASERDTRLIFRTMGNTARVLRNAVSEEVVAAEAKGCEFAAIKHLVAGARGREALLAGNPDGGVIAAGQVVGLIDDIPSCAELIERMVEECRERLRHVTGYFN